MTAPTTRRRFLVLLGTTAALTACGVGTPAADVTLSEEPVTLRFAWWGGDARHTRTQQVIDAFTAEHPAITVEGEFSDWTGYWDRMATTFAANDAADVVQMDEYYLRTYADRGSLLDLATAGEFLDYSGFPEQSLQSGQAGDVQYALPTGQGAVSLIANVDLFEQYGIPLPDDTTWTWDDLAALAAQLTRASGGAVHGLGNFGQDVNMLTVVSRQRGASLYDSQGQVVLPPELLAEWWTFTRGLIDTGASLPAVRQSELLTVPITQGALPVGEAAMAIYYNIQITAVQPIVPDTRLQLLQLPRTTGSPVVGNYFKPSMYWSISSRSEHPAEAALFVDYLVNSTAAAEILGTERGIPANTAALDSLRPTLDAPSRQAVALNDALVDVVDAPPELTPPGASGIEALHRRWWTEVMFDRLTPEQAAQGFIDELRAGVENAGG